MSICCYQCVRWCVRQCVPSFSHSSRRLHHRRTRQTLFIIDQTSSRIGHTSRAVMASHTVPPTVRTLASTAGPGVSFTDPEVVKFLDKTYDLMKTVALQGGTDRSTPVVRFKHPHELQELLNLDIQDGPTDHDTLLEEMKKVVDYSVKTGHPYFFNQLYGGLDPYSQAGAWLTETITTNIHTFEVSPVFIVMEKYVFAKLCHLLGYSNGEGLFCPGGSASNIMALHLARYRKFPTIKQDGMYNCPRLRCYVSEDGHYSLKKAAPYLGIGLSNVVSIATDERGKVCLRDFERKIKEDINKGYVPLFMMATSGSTVLGSFDPLVELGDICDKYGIWLHADACWGGGALLSEKYRHLCAGTDRCDSIAWNFHKFTGSPIQASALIIKQKDLLLEANSFKAEYLFQPDKFYDNSFDIGDRTVQCGRKVDVVKVWLQWKAMGDKGFEALVDKAYDNARYLTDKLRTTHGFRLVLPEFECTNICFWYIPAQLRGRVEDQAWWNEVGQVAPKIKERMVKSGTMMIGYNPLSSKNLVNFFRIILHNPLLEHADMDFVIEEIERLGKDL